MASAIYMQGKVYAICGRTNDGVSSTIEKIDLASSGSPLPFWQIIMLGNNDLLRPRFDSAVAQLNDYEFAILGGFDAHLERLGDIFTFAADHDTLERRVEESSIWNIFGRQFKFYCCRNQSTMVTTNTVAAVVYSD